MLAAAIKEPSLALDPEEAKRLAIAAGNVARHYDLGASQKTLDWMALAVALGSIYGTRAVAIYMNRKEQPKNNG